MLISMEYVAQENISGEIYTVGKLTKIKTNVYNIIKNECKKIANGFNNVVRRCAMSIKKKKAIQKVIILNRFSSFQTTEKH